MKTLFPLAIVALSVTVAQAQPEPVRTTETERQLLEAVQQLTRTLDALSAPQPVAIASSPVVSSTGELGCDGMISSVQSVPTTMNVSVPAVSVQNVPLTFQTIRTRTPLITRRLGSGATFEWIEEPWWMVWRRRELRTVGPYVIDVRPRLFGLLGSRVQVFQ